jgi:hypothetical protein
MAHRSGISSTGKYRKRKKILSISQAGPDIPLIFLTKAKFPPTPNIPDFLQNLIELEFYRFSLRKSKMFLQGLIWKNKTLFDLPSPKNPTPLGKIGLKWDLKWGSNHILAIFLRF